MRTIRYRPPVFPFTALVGQELLKLGLVLNAINPQLSGILIRGDKGTAKSTAVRALARLLPEIDEVADCPFHCDPYEESMLCASCRERLAGGEELPVETVPVRVVDLPLNTTEDRLVGSIDFEHALRTGFKRFQPGLLAESNRGIIYIDEVNLLEDHLVDILLDTAVTGINIVERESISYIHPSRYILIATMNPEEGDIRPQLLDRFGFAVGITGISVPGDRVEIARRREEFDTDPEEFIGKWEAEQGRLRKRILSGQELLPYVTINEEQRYQITVISATHHVAGHRADIMMEKAARTLAAYSGRNEVQNTDIYQAAQLVLPHRSRHTEDALDKEKETRPDQEKRKPDSDGSAEKDMSDMNEPGAEPEDGPGTPGDPTEASDAAARETDELRQGMMDMRAGPDDGKPQEKVFEIGDLVKIPTYDIRFARDSLKRKTGGRRSVTTTNNKTGRYVRATAQRQNNDLAFDATLRAASPYQRSRPKSDLAVNIKEPDIREKVRQKKTSNLLLFVVDASGSMGTRLMTETKGTILALLLEAYQKRDKVGMIAFKGQDADVLLPPTSSIELAKRLLEELPTGGKTPLGLGLLTAYQVLRGQLRQDPSLLPLMIVITDGRANVGLCRDKYYDGPQFGEIYREIYQICDLFSCEEKMRTLVIDAEEKRMGSFGRSKKLAEALNAKYYMLEEIISQNILETVKKETK